MSVLRRLLPTRLGSQLKVPTERDGGCQLRALPPSIDECRRVTADATALGAAGRWGEALALIVSALEAAPEDAELLSARARILFDWGRYREALESYLEAEAKGLRGAPLELQLGWSYLYTGDGERAEARMRQAIAAKPESALAHYGLAMVLRAQHRRDAAAASLERAVDLDPDAFDALLELGNCRVEQNEVLAGEALFRRAIAVDSERAVGWQNLGVVLERERRFDEALAAFERAEVLAAQNAAELDAFVNLAIELGDRGRISAALALCERILPQRPSVHGHSVYSQLLLAAGKFVEGWHHFEFRWLNEPLLSARFRFAGTAWAGQDLHGKTIRLRLEQGLGDVIQFVRYATVLKSLGARVQIPGFDALAGRFFGIDQVIRAGAPPEECDYHVNLPSLPRILGTELASIPASVPYLDVAPDKLAQWAPRLVAAEHVLKVGLVWAGNPAHRRDRERSIALGMLAPLANVSGVRWYSLQKGSREEDAAAPTPGLDWVNLGPDLSDFSDTAAVISLLDLILCVDTAVAHLAGALGKPVWMLVAEPADWRWLKSREDSPWYPTMRIFRQNARGDWRGVIDRVRSALQEMPREARRDLIGSDRRAPRHEQPVQPIATVEDALRGHKAGFSAVTETRAGILQYLPDEPDSGASLAWYGEWRQSELDLLGRLLRQGETVLEVGPGVGAQALFLAGAIGSTGHLILYEGRPLQRRILQQNLAANRISNATLLHARPHGASASIVMGTVDELQLGRLDWLKLTDEATAIEVLEGAGQTLWRLRPLWLSAAPSEPVVTALRDRAREYGYRCWRIETALFNPKNFNRRRDDIFPGRTALALLAIPEEVEVNVALDGCVEL